MVYNNFCNSDNTICSSCPFSKIICFNEITKNMNRIPEFNLWSTDLTTKLKFTCTSCNVLLLKKVNPLCLPFKKDAQDKHHTSLWKKKAIGRNASTTETRVWKSSTSKQRSLGLSSHHDFGSVATRKKLKRAGRRITYGSTKHIVFD